MNIFLIIVLSLIVIELSFIMMASCSFIGMLATMAKEMSVEFEKGLEPKRTKKSKN